MAHVCRFSIDMQIVQRDGFGTEAPNCLVTSLLTWPNLILHGSLLCWGSIGIMENKMETTIILGVIGVI